MATDNLDLRLRLTVDRDGRLQAVLSDTRGRLRNLGAEGERAGRRIDRGFGQARAGIESISRQLQTTRRQIAAFFSVQYVGRFVGQTVRLADEYKTLQARLKLAAETQAEFNQAQAELFQIAQRSRSELSAVVDLYARIGPALKAATGSQKEALQVTETILETIQLSGSDAAAGGAAIRQLAQALQAGALKGDEFVSVMEGAPALMRAIADGMGVPIGKLKQLASEGKLTAEAVARALQKQKALIEAEFGQLPVTVGQALTRLENRWQRFLGGMDAEAGFTDSLAAAIDGLAEHFDQAVAAAKALAVFGGAHLAGSLARELRVLSEAAFQRRMAHEARRHAERTRRLRTRGLDAFLDGEPGFAASLRAELESLGGTAETVGDAISKKFAETGLSITDSLADSVMQGKSAMESLKASVTSAIIDVIKLIGRMMMARALQASLQNSAGGGGGGGGGYVSGSLGASYTGSASAAITPSFGSGIYHTGGIVGSGDGGRRRVSARVFESAPRFHTGGIAHNEVPAVLQKGEGVFTREQMKALAPVDKLKPGVNVQVNLIESDRDQGSVSHDENSDGGITLDVMVARIRDRLAGEMEQGGGLAPSLERLYGLKRSGY